MAETDIRPFTIDVADEVLDDLRRRLRATRWPEPETVDDWMQGIPLAYVQDLCRTWAEDYDWRAREARLNRFDHFVTDLDGLDIHFVHQRSPHPEALPLLITHGWPGSIVEFDRVIEPLVDPVAHGGDAADAFHVIAPSLPGYGFSGKPTRTGWTVDRIAGQWAALMARLGYDRYVAQGGDWGSAVTTAVGALDPDHCASIHITLMMSARPTISDPPTPEEQRALDAADWFRKWGNGYSTQQYTRPQTIGYGLVDSPAAQLAWIVEKFQEWTDNDGDVESVIDRQHLLDNVMLYWVNAAGASSARLYWESFRRVTPHEVTIPSGFAVYPRENVPPVRSWVEPLYTDIVHWAEHERGGHFAAMEVPETFVADLRAWARHARR